MPVVVITGASAGLGESLAREFHQRGYRVVLLARRLDRLIKISDELNQIKPDTAWAMECDVTQAAQLKQACEQILLKWGSIDGVIANAGYGVAGAFDTLTTEHYRQQFETNVFGVLETFYQFKSALLTQNKNHKFFAVVGSVNSYLSLPTASAYAMSKFSVRALTEAWYWELKSQEVSVTLICPGFIKTEIRKVNNRGIYQPTNRDPIPEWIMMSSTKAAQIAVRAILRKKREVVITLHGKIFVWLARHCPWILSPLHRAVLGKRRQGASARPWNDSQSG